jgi:serine/threonine protein kinase
LIERELTTLKSLNHPFLTKMVDLIKDKNNRPCIIMEKSDEKSLQNVLDDKIKNGGNFSEQEIIRIITMVSIGLAYMHTHSDQPIVH